MLSTENLRLFPVSSVIEALLEDSALFSTDTSLLSSLVSFWIRLFNITCPFFSMYTILLCFSSIMTLLLDSPDTAFTSIYTGFIPDFTPILIFCSATIC